MGGGGSLEPRVAQERCSVGRERGPLGLSWIRCAPILGAVEDDSEAVDVVDAVDAMDSDRMCLLAEEAEAEERVVVIVDVDVEDSFERNDRLSSESPPLVGESLS